MSNLNVDRANEKANCSAQVNKTFFPVAAIINHSFGRRGLIHLLLPDGGDKDPRTLVKIGIKRMVKLRRIEKKKKDTNGDINVVPLCSLRLQGFRDANMVKIRTPQTWSYYKPGLIMLEVAGSNWEVVTGAEQHKIKPNCFGGENAGSSGGIQRKQDQ